MARGPSVERTGEALVLRAWPFQEADLLVSLFTREHGRIKGIARHAMRSRRRFGGALEPMTHVHARWTERPRRPLAQESDLVRLDAFEILSSPLSQPIDYSRLAALSLLAEVLDELPEGAVDDPVFRLALTVLPALSSQPNPLPVAYFCLWMNRLQGWLPSLTRCVVCGESIACQPAFWSPASDGLTCADDRRADSQDLAPEALASAQHMLREPLASLLQSPWPTGAVKTLRRWTLAMLERHLERRLRTAHAVLNA